jgi:hypothetical protein
VGRRCSLVSVIVLREPASLPRVRVCVPEISSLEQAFDRQPMATRIRDLLADDDAAKVHRFDTVVGSRLNQCLCHLRRPGSAIPVPNRPEIRGDAVDSSVVGYRER